MKEIKIGEDKETLYYNDFCIDDQPLIKPNSECNVTFNGDKTINLECEYTKSVDGEEVKEEYTIDFTKYEDGSKAVDKIVSESITSYPIPIKRSFVIGEHFYSGDRFIGSVNDDENINTLEVAIRDRTIQHYSMIL